MASNVSSFKPHSRPEVSSNRNDVRYSAGAGRQAVVNTLAQPLLAQGGNSCPRCASLEGRQVTEGPLCDRCLHVPRPQSSQPHSSQNDWVDGTYYAPSSHRSHLGCHGGMIGDGQAIADIGNVTFRAAEATVKMVAQLPSESVEIVKEGVSFLQRLGECLSCLCKGLSFVAKPLVFLCKGVVLLFKCVMFVFSFFN